MFADRRYNRVHMVRHNHKIAQLIAQSVKVEKAGFHDSFAIRARQDAPAVAGIKPAIYRLGEASMIFLLLAVSVRLRIETEPEFLLASKPLQLGLRQCVCKAKGDKIDCSFLSPMREFSTTDYQRCFRVEKGHTKY